jgi:hypothetical protein
VRFGINMMFSPFYGSVTVIYEVAATRQPRSQAWAGTTLACDAR